MNATRWLKLTAIAALAYILYDLVPSPLPDLPGDARRIVLSVLLGAVLLSGNAAMADRRAERERERRLAEEKTVVLQPVQPVPPVGRVFVVERPRLDPAGIDPEAVAIARRIARRLSGEDVRH